MVVCFKGEKNDFLYVKNFSTGYFALIKNFIVNRQFLVTFWIYPLRRRGRILVFLVIFTILSKPRRNNGDIRAINSLRFFTNQLKTIVDSP